jgi:hypothetical protein
MTLTPLFVKTLMQLRYQYKTRDSVFHVFTEVPLSSHESKWSCICALELSKESTQNGEHDIFDLRTMLGIMRGIDFCVIQCLLPRYRGPS